MNELTNNYFKPTSRGSFGGIQRLARTTKQPQTKVKKWLQKHDTYTLHHPVRTRFQRRKTIVYAPKTQYQVDLIDVQKLKRFNKKFGYIITCIYVFSKVAAAFPIKNKTSTQVLAGMKKVFRQLGTPIKIQSDLGKESWSRKMQDYYKKNSVKHFSTQNETIKAAVVERFKRTL